MAKFDPPWRLDPLKNIINVGWNGTFVALQFHADASTGSEEGPGGSGSPTSVNPIIELPQIGASFAIFGNTSTPIARNPKPGYHKETNDHIDGETVTSQHYTILVTYHHGASSGNAGGDVYVTTIGSVSFWSGFAGGTDHTGGIDAAAAFFLASGWDTFEATLVSTETSTTDPVDNRSLEDTGVLIISIAAVRKAMTDKDATSFLIEFDTGFSRGNFSWEATIGTFRKVKFDSFPLDDKNKPVNWKTPIDTKTVSGTTNKHLRFQIDFTTLKITSS